VRGRTSTIVPPHSLVVLRSTLYNPGLVLGQSKDLRPSWPISVSVYATPGKTLQNPSAIVLGRMPGRISCSFTMFEALYDMAYFESPRVVRA
jgi:hypothetical protein